jgi:hypothetical protein
MPERVSIADGDDLLFRERAMWLLIRRLCRDGRAAVTVTDEEWEQVPERPELIIARSGDAMVWTARERSEEKGAGHG